MTSPTDVSVTVAELRQQAGSDHVRGCMGRQYSCDCGFDLRTEGLIEQAADLLESQAKALSEAKVERDALRAECRESNSLAAENFKRALAAEARLAEFKAEATKVIEPFVYYFDLNDCRGRNDDDALDVPIRDLRAAHSFLNAQEKA